MREIIKGEEPPVTRTAVIFTAMVKGLRNIADRHTRRVQRPNNVRQGSEQLPRRQ